MRTLRFDAGRDQGARLHSALLRTAALDGFRRPSSDADCRIVRDEGQVIESVRVRASARYSIKPEIAEGARKLDHQAGRLLGQNRDSTAGNSTLGWSGRSKPMPECFVAKASEMQDGDRRIVVAGSAEIGVFYKDGDYFAYSNYCVHSGGPACEGLMINRVVDVIAPDRTYQGQTFSDEVHFVCPWHGYEFELRTGECVGDRRLRLKKFDVVRRGDDIFVVA
jgi:nitrite reductase/ring-hydroxylating ferredoxin subunit